MNLPDENLWDETICNSVICQHPQCWAAIRRIERGNPRMLRSSYKTSLDMEDKLPVLTVVNIPDASRPTRLAQHPAGSTLTKAHSKFDSRFQGRTQKHDKGLVISANRHPKVSVLNLNDTLLPCLHDVRNMAVIWIPEEPEKYRRSSAKKAGVTSQDEREKRKKSAMEDQASPSCLGHEVVVPPPSPAHLSEPLSPIRMLSWPHTDMLPQDLLKDLLAEEGETMLSPTMRIELAMMKKNHPLEKSQPDSAISSEMFLSVHRLTLQRRGLSQPAHLRKFHNNLMTKARFPEATRSPDPRKQQQQQQRKVKTPAKKQELKEETKSDTEIWSTLYKHEVDTIYELVSETCIGSLEEAEESESHSGHSSLPDQENDTKQPQQMEIEGPTLKQDATEHPEMDRHATLPDSLHKSRSTELVRTESTKEDISAQGKVELESQTSSEEKTPKNLSDSTAGTAWNPELKLLEIHQDSDDEEKEVLPLPSRAKSEDSLEAQAEDITQGNPIREQDT